MSQFKFFAAFHETETRAFHIGGVLTPERGNLNALFLVIFKD